MRESAAIGMSRMLRFCFADEIKKQVQRTFEGIEKHLQRFRRNVEILRHLGHRLIR